MTMKLLRKNEVAGILGVSPRSVDRLRARGDLKAVRVLRSVRFAQADVEAYISNQKGGAR